VFGYTYQDSDAGGPTLGLVDISAIGTQIAFQR